MSFDPRVRSGDFTRSAFISQGAHHRWRVISTDPIAFQRAVVYLALANPRPLPHRRAHAPALDDARSTEDRRRPLSRRISSLAHRSSIPPRSSAADAPPVPSARPADLPIAYRDVHGFES